MAQAAELVRVADVGKSEKAGLAFFTRTRSALAGVRARSRQRRALDGYLAARDLGRQTGTWG